MNFKNLNKIKVNEVLVISEAIKSKNIKEGIDIGDIDVQIRTENYDVAVSFSNGYKLIITANDIDDYSNGHINMERVISKSRLEKL